MNKIYLNLLILLLFFFSYFFFYASLEKCTQGEDVCCKKFKWMKLKLIEEAISCVFTILLLELIVLKKISKIHLTHFITVYILFFLYSNGIDFEDHGYYNIKYFFVIVISALIIISLLKNFLTLKQNFFRLYIIFTFTIIYVIMSVFYENIICNDWERGLNNTSIDNDKKKYECLIQTPKYCPYKIGKYFLDRNKFNKIDCTKKRDNSWKKMLKYSKSPYINKNTLHIGFPLTNKDEKFFYDMNVSTYKNYIRENLVDMNNSTLLEFLKEKRPEISIDFSKNQYGKMNVNLNYNMTLSSERMKLEKFSNPYSKNILILYIDSVSRAYSIRQLKKTLMFFEKFISFKGNSNPKFPNENFHSFQFFKYHSHKYFTAGNYPILFYGNHINRTNKYITLCLKKNGFITGYSSDTCYYDFTRSYHNFSFDDMYDHRYVVCDPKYYSSRIFTCMYGKLHIEYMIDYINQFWRKYKENRKFLLFLTNFAHEGTLEKLKYIDNIIYQYLNNLFNDNLLKETSIFLLSDHGVTIPSIYYLNDFFNYEQVLPMLYLLINDRKNISYESQYGNLYQNQQTFITGFDIYNTIINIIYGDQYGTRRIIKYKSVYGKSLFSEIKQIKRAPKYYNLMDKYCCIQNKIFRKRN